MRYLGIEPKKLRVAVFSFTGCQGCALQLANKEETLGAFLDSIEIARFREISSAVSDDYDIAFVDGAVSRSDEVKRLRDIRSRAKVLVAMGSCACYGGVNRLKNAFSIEEANREVYGDQPKESWPTRSTREVVPVDLEIPGCPISKAELERIVQHVAFGLDYPFPVYPVCMECKQSFTTCLFDLGQLCLGSVTRAGCGAPCPAGGLGCWGCRGPAEEPNIKAFLELAEHHGFSAEEVRERFEFFGGFAELDEVAQLERGAQ